MYKTVILILCVSLESMAQIKVPNGDFNQFESVGHDSHAYSLPVGWKEHQKNEYWRSGDGHGFAYKYDLPDADKNAVALHRGCPQSHLTEDNAIFSSFSTPERYENLTLKGRYKFSGSDIKEAIDTLKVIAFTTPEQLQNIPDKFPQNATVLNVVSPTSQFEWFNLDMDETERDNYLTIVIQLKSGSDDSYYWGYANAVLDDLAFVTKQNF